MSKRSKMTPWHVGEPCWEVQRELNGRWTALGIWPADTKGEEAARGYFAQCESNAGIRVRLLSPVRPTTPEGPATVERPTPTTEGKG